MIDYDEIKVLVIDLDNCLTDSLNGMAIPMRKKIEKLMEEQGHDEYLPAIRASGWKKGFDRTMEEANVPHKIAKELRKVYDLGDVSDMELFPDSPSILKLPMRKVLLTRGDPRLQNEKIDHLRIRDNFDSIHVTPVYETKLDALKEILEEEKVEPKAILVIGDRVVEEIRFGNELGMQTVYVKREGHPVVESEEPDLTIPTFDPLVEELKRHL